MGEMTMWDMFDGVVSLAFTGLPQRARLMDLEFDRVGLGGRTFRIWQFPTPFDAVIQSRVRCSGGMMRTGYFNSGMGHYRAVKTALCLGLRTVLVVEDDIRFPKDLDRLRKGLEEAPPDWSVLLLDVLKADKDPVETVVRAPRELRVGNTTWCASWGNPRSFGCYALTRPAMEWLVRRIEGPCAPTASGILTLRNVDLNLRADRVDPGLKVYWASPNLAIQVPVGDGQFNSSGGNPDKYLDFYRAIGVDPADYAG